MKKGWFLVGIIFLLVPWLLVGCGISEEVYNAVVAERDALQTEATSLKIELSAKETELLSVQSELSAKETELLSVQNQLSAKEGELQTAQSELETATGKLKGGKARMEVINALWVPIMRGEDIGGVASFFEWRDQIVAIGDPILTESFNEMMDMGVGENLIEFFVYLFESVAEVLK